MKRSSVTAALAAAGVAAMGGLAFAWAKRTPATSDDAPGNTARRGRFGDFAVTGTTVTITKPPRAELFSFWRDFANLAGFMENLDRVEKRGEGWRWTIRGRRCCPSRGARTSGAAMSRWGSPAPRCGSRRSTRRRSRPTTRSACS